MRDVCKAEVEAALGRKPTQKELDKIENTIKEVMRSVYQKNKRNNKTLPDKDIFRQAIKEQAQRLVQDEIERKLVTARDALKMSRALADLEAVPAPQRVLEVLRWLIDKAKLEKSGRQSIESRKEAIERYAWSQLLPLQKILTNPDKLKLFAREVFGEKTGDAEAAAAAKAYQENGQRMIDHAKAAGMPIEALSSWHLPQQLSDILPESVETLAKDLYKSVDRGMYRNEDGSLYNDKQMMDTVIAEARLIITDGSAIDANTGLPIYGNTSRRGYQKARGIHYKDYASWQKMQDKYGNMTLPQLLFGHIKAMSRDTALTEMFGSDWREGFRKVLDAELEPTIENGQWKLVRMFA